MEFPESHVLSPGLGDAEALVVQTKSQIPSTAKAKHNDIAVSLEFASVLTSKIQELELRGPAQCSTERESVKVRRKALKELQKYVLDKSNTLEDKIAFVQAKYTSQVSPCAIPVSESDFKLEINCLNADNRFLEDGETLL